MHNYKESDRTSPYLAKCFDISLCGILAPEWPHKLHEEDRHTTYQLKVDVPIAHNEQNGKQNYEVIIAFLE